VTPQSTGLVLSDLTLSAIQAEATRAHLKHGPKGQSMLCSISDERRLAIAAEEVGEVARWLNELVLGNEPDPDEFEIELIQCAAMFASWVEAKGQGL
jgi:hypothetical protein